MTVWYYNYWENKYVYVYIYVIYVYKNIIYLLTSNHLLHYGLFQWDLNKMRTKQSGKTYFQYWLIAFPDEMISPPWTERPWKRSFGSKSISQFLWQNFSKIPFALRLSQPTHGLERNMIQPKIGKSFMLPVSGMTICGDHHLNFPKEWQNLRFWNGIGEQTFPDFPYIRKVSKIP